MLTRSHAMREATSPPPDPAASASSTAAMLVATTTSSQQVPATVLNNSNGKSNSQASKASNNNHNGSGSNHHHHHTSNNNNYKNKNGNNKISKEQNISSNRPNRAHQNKNYIYISSPQEAWGGLLSQDYSTTLQCQDAAKADLLGFIAAQMTTKNRALLLRVEEELKQLVQDQRLEKTNPTKHNKKKKKLCIKKHLAST